MHTLRISPVSKMADTMEASDVGRLNPHVLPVLCCPLLGAFVDVFAEANFGGGEPVDAYADDAPMSYEEASILFSPSGLSNGMTRSPRKGASLDEILSFRQESLSNA